MDKGKKKGVRIESLSIRDYKGIDHLELEFPLPPMESDPDITVIGSRNGVGKTSVLECCALLLAAASPQDKSLHPLVGQRSIESYVRVGTAHVALSGGVSVEGACRSVDITLFPVSVKARGGNIDVSNIILSQALQLLEPTTNPLINTSFVFLQSHRKVQEGRIKLGELLDGAKEPAGGLFKQLALRSMMRDAGMFEVEEAAKYDGFMDRLNSLLGDFAEVKLGKLKPYADNTMDIRVTPFGRDDTYSFDGLSSGQKEMVATLFLIWACTKDNPKVVLIDEPELHLNIEWHRLFIEKMMELAPRNQYIVATHSEDVMGAVPSEQRVILTNEMELERK